MIGPLLLGGVFSAATELATPQCIEVDAWVRRTAYGYDHLATVSNGCAEAMRCFLRATPRTDTVEMKLERDEAKTIVTLRGSPSRRIETHAECEPAAGRDVPTR